MENTPIRVRMAPSPTGQFHVGSARTTLFNWLFALHEKGTFILRIEDTDKERSTGEFEKDILENIAAFGWGAQKKYPWYEGPLVSGGEQGEFGPYRQSERIAQNIYAPYIQKLLDKKTAWYCTCTKEELEKNKTQGQAFIDPCFEKNYPAGESSVIRFRVPGEQLSFTDLIRGEISFDNTLLGDIVIARNLQDPLYNFAVVVDDELMKISHVIRGEDHINNTPKQIALILALGFQIPHYAHVPLILNTNKSKMSKRNKPEGVSVTVADYWQAGYHPEALKNFLLLLGWHDEGDREIFSPEEAVSAFTLDRVQKSGAVFNVEKLNSLSTTYFKQQTPEEILNLHDTYPLGQTFLPSQWRADEEKLKKILSLIKERMITFSDGVTQANFFFELPDYKETSLVWKKSTPEATKNYLENFSQLIEKIPNNWELKDIEETLMPYAEKEGRAESLWPLRFALSGQERSPSPFEILWVLGLEEAQKRLKIALKRLS